MPDIIDTEYDVNRLFGADGLVHTAVRQNLTSRYHKRAVAMRPEDPTVCLTCTAETCDGTDECYRKRKKQLDIQRRQNHEDHEPQTAPHGEDDP